jgi:AcrR family transcriptional regulator
MAVAGSQVPPWGWRERSFSGILAAATELFYAHGVTAVGMDAIRAASGVPLKRLYRCFVSKEQLVAAYLGRRDEQWMAALAGYVERSRDPRQRVLAVFAFLADWFATAGFRGCAFINAFGELGSESGLVAEAALRHKRRLSDYLAGLAADAGATAPGVLAAQPLILIDGATVSAATGTSPRAAADAATAAVTLLAVACPGQPGY